MKRCGFRTNLLGLAIGGTLLACGSAWGGPLPAPSATPCTANMTVATFAGFGTAGCSEGDKTYVWQSNSADISADTITVNELTLGSGDIQHNFSLTFGTGVAEPFTASLGYLVFMNSLSVGFLGIDSVTFDTTTGGPTEPLVQGLSIITPANPVGPVITLTSTNGIPEGTVTTGEPQQLTYLDGWTVTANGTLFSSADTLIETKSVPEPASLLLVGLGMSALGFMRRRKQS